MAQHSVLTLIFSLAVFAATVVSILRGGRLTNDVLPEEVDSVRAYKLVESELAARPAFDLLVSSRDWTVDDAAYRAALDRALAVARTDPRVVSVRTIYDVPEKQAALRRSKDGRHTLVTVELAGDRKEAARAYPKVRATITSTELTFRAASGQAAFDELNHLLASDLQRGELISLPLAFLLLLFVFGTAVAASLPIGVGLFTVAGGLGGVFALARVSDVSPYALNIVTLIGLGVSIDYSLFVVSRYREELAVDGNVKESVARAVGTAGRATAFSAVTVAIGLAGMLFFRHTFLASMGIAGAISVLFSIFYTLTFLPAVLTLLGTRVNRLRIPLGISSRDSSFWRRFASLVMRHPLAFFVPVLGLVVAAGVPFSRVRLATTDNRTMPAESETRQAADIIADEFPAGQTTFQIVVTFPGDPLARERVGALHDLAQRMARVDGVLGVDSIVTFDPRLTRAQLQDLLTGPRERLPAPVQAAITKTVGKDIVVLGLRVDRAAQSDEARALVDKLREIGSAGDGHVLVGGRTAIDGDLVQYIRGKTPSALAFVVLITYLLVMLQVRSILIPLKAVLMNLLSILTSFGALVWFFQDGHLSSTLNFRAGSIDPTLPVILFCVVFGLSMDYEVLLLARIHEEYVATRDNTRAVVEGIQRSARLITGAAAIMVVVFGAFALARVVVIKALGVGLALAIVVDATLVRAILVPATMKMLGNMNWWAPRWFSRASRESSKG